MSDLVIGVVVAATRMLKTSFCRAPVQYTLPTPPVSSASTGNCTLSAEPCYLFSAGTGVHTRNAVLSCQIPLAATPSLQTSVTYQTVNATRWLQATAASNPSGSTNVIFRCKRLPAKFLASCSSDSPHKIICFTSSQEAKAQAALIYVSRGRSALEKPKLQQW